MDLPDIIHRNKNYVKSLHATSNNENKNIIFIQQFYIPKRTSTSVIYTTVTLVMLPNKITTCELSEHGRKDQYRDYIKSFQKHN